MHSTAGRAVVERFLELANRGEMEACFDLFSDDLTWTNIGSTVFSGTFRGKQAVLEDLLGPLFGALRDGIRSDVQAIVADGDRVVVLSEGRATTREGVPYNNSYAQVYTVREGQIVAVTEYMDTALVDAVFGARH